MSATVLRVTTGLDVKTTGYLGMDFWRGCEGGCRCFFCAGEFTYNTPHTDVTPCCWPGELLL